MGNFYLANEKFKYNFIYNVVGFIYTYLGDSVVSISLNCNCICFVFVIVLCVTCVSGYCPFTRPFWVFSAFCMLRGWTTRVVKYFNIYNYLTEIYIYKM